MICDIKVARELTCSCGAQSEKQLKCELHSLLRIFSLVGLHWNLESWFI